MGRLRRRAVAVGPPLLVVALIALAGCAALVLTSPWPLGLTLRQFAAALGCPVAQAVGLAPARPGEPGWRTRLDPDLDGWSCAARPGGAVASGPCDGGNDQMRISRWRIPAVAGDEFLVLSIVERGDQVSLM